MVNLMQLVGVKDRIFLDLLARMLDPNPNTRISIVDVLRHPFLTPLLPFTPPSSTLSLDPSLPVNDMKKENHVPVDDNSVDSQLQELAEQMTPVKTRRTRLEDNRKPPVNPIRKRAKTIE